MSEPGQPVFLVVELAAVDGQTACSIMVCEVSPLNHKVGYDPMKRAPFVCQLSSSRMRSISLCQCFEIQYCLRNRIAVQPNFDSSRISAVDAHVEEHTGSDFLQGLVVDHIVFVLHGPVRDGPGEIHPNEICTHHRSNGTNLPC